MSSTELGTKTKGEPLGGFGVSMLILANLGFVVLGIPMHGLMTLSAQIQDHPIEWYSWINLSWPICFAAAWGAFLLARRAEALAAGTWFFVGIFSIWFWGSLSLM